MADDKNDKPIADIAKPGKTPADPTSRPVIVGHKSLAQDPMVTEKKSEQPPAKPLVSPSATNKVVVPLSETKPSEPAADSKEEKPEEKSEEPKSDEASTSSDEAVVDALADQAADKKEAEKVDEEELKNREAVAKLIEDKKYYVSIGQAKRRRKNIWLALVLTAILLLAGVYAADAGFIPGVKLPFDFIKEQKLDSGDAPAASTAQTNNEETKETKPEVKTLTSTGAEYVSEVGKFAMTVPKDWKITETISDFGDGLKIGDIKIETPTKKVYDMSYNFGGRGGDCPVEADDKPFAKDNSCPTTEYLYVEELKPDATTTSLLKKSSEDKTQGKLYLVHKKQDSQNSISYCIGLRTAYSKPVLNEPKVGYANRDEQVYAEGQFSYQGGNIGYQYDFCAISGASINTDEGFISSAEGKQLVGMLKTFRIIK